TESLLLGALSGAAAVGLALFGVEALLSLAPPDLTLFASRTIEIDGRVLWFTGGLSVATGVFLGLLPGLGVIRAANATSGATMGSYGSRTRGSHRLRGALVVSQVALSLVVLFGAGLLGRSFNRLVSVDPGFDPEGLATVSLLLSEAKYPSRQARAAAVRSFEDRLHGIPGVTSLSTSDRLPLSGGYTFGRDLWVEGDAEPVQPGTTLMPTLAGDPEFRPTLGMRLVSGRDFDATLDPSQRPVLVTRTLSELISRGGDATGLRFRFGTAVPWWTVVGVVEDMSLSTGMGLNAYGVISLLPRAGHGLRLAFTAHTEGDPNALLPAMRRAIHEVDPNQPIARLRTFDQVMWESVSRPWFFLVLMGIFAALALLLASLGLYGVLSFSVTQRTREMGIRVALGAGARRVRSLVLGEGLRLAAIGTVLGVGTSLWASRTVEDLLFETSRTDILTLVVVATTMMTIAAVASYVPARRATRVDPVEVLKAE
ncbi:MAG: FtsX-like permease family protein, partial [Longimicrobiales bacterium]